jgi:hypothetical protein
LHTYSDGFVFKCSAVVGPFAQRLAKSLVWGDAGAGDEHEEVTAKEEGDEIAALEYRGWGHVICYLAGYSE